MCKKLDVRQSYLQVPMAKGSKCLTAGITHDGILQSRRMPYGLSSVTSEFQKILATVLSGIEGCIHLLDDIVIHGQNKAEQDQRLNAVMTRLAKSNFTLNHDKCQFNRDEVDLLGYHVSSVGVRPLNSNVQAINGFPEPNNSSEITSFLVATNFYLKFVENDTDVAEPQHTLLCKDTPWKWSIEQTQDFQSLKRRIASAPILAHSDPNTPTIITTDASGIALGAVLSQVSNGVELPVACVKNTVRD